MVAKRVHLLTISKLIWACEYMSTGACPLSAAGPNGKTKDSQGWLSSTFQGLDDILKPFFM